MKNPVKFLKKALGCVWRMLPSTTALAPAPAPVHWDELPFITFVLIVKHRRWQKVISDLLRNMKGVRFQMNKAGRVEVNGVGDPDRLLRRIGKSINVSLEYIQFGQCSTYLFMPPEPPKKDPAPAPAPAPAAALKEKPITQNQSLPSYAGYPPYGNIGFQHLPSYAAGYAPYGNIGFQPSYAGYDPYYSQPQLQQGPFTFWQ